MKKIIVSTLLMSVIVCGYDTLEESVKESHITLDSTLFYFDRDFDKPSTPNAKALTLGGIAKIVTAPWHGLQVGVAPYGNFLTGFTKRDEATGSSMLEQKENKNLTFLGEAYAHYALDKSSLYIGRQRLSTPLANDHDLRALPSTYSGIIFKTREIEKTLIEAGWIESYTGFGSKYNSFSTENTKWGERGLGYIYIENTTLANTQIHAQYIKAIDNQVIFLSDYRYADIKYNFMPNISLETQYGGNDYKSGDNSQMLGVRTQFNTTYIDTALLYNQIMDNKFQALEAGPMYSDWQQGYGNYEPSQAIGGYIKLKPFTNATIKLGSVKVTAKEKSLKDDFTESNLDCNYALNTQHKLRVRYSIKDETDEANALGYEDRTDFRVIYYYSFATKK